MKALGVGDADAGLYAAAQNIARIPYFLMSGLAVLVLPALAGMMREGAQARAGAARQAIRIAVLAAVPIAAIVESSSTGALDLLYGSTYATGSGRAFDPCGGHGRAGDRFGRGWRAQRSGPPRLVGHDRSTRLQRRGCRLCGTRLCAWARGGAIATSASTAVSLTLLLARLGSILPGALPWTSMLRVTAISAAVGIGLAVLDARGLALIGAYIAASVIGVGLLIVSGEVGREDLDRLRSGLQRR